VGVVGRRRRRRRKRTTRTTRTTTKRRNSQTMTLFCVGSMRSVRSQDTKRSWYESGWQMMAAK